MGPIDLARPENAGNESRVSKVLTYESVLHQPKRHGCGFCVTVASTFFLAIRKVSPRLDLNYFYNLDKKAEHTYTVGEIFSYSKS